jgi:Putative zinc-finger
MKMADTHDDMHAEAEELLPWYSTGQLDGKDRAMVEKHLASCVACQRQLRFDQRMIEELGAFDPQVESGWSRLRSRIEQDESGRPRGLPIFGAAWTILRRPAVAMLVAAQLAFVVLASAAFLSLSRPDYRALSGATQPPPANVIVIFRPDATQKDMLDSLHASAATVAGGPTPADAYLLRVAPQRRNAVLKQLQADPGVQMAQPIDGVAQ